MFGSVDEATTGRMFGSLVGSVRAGGDPASGGGSLALVAEVGAGDVSDTTAGGRAASLPVEFGHRIRSGNMHPVMVAVSGAARA
jgi:hypothetical protein